MDSVPLFGIAIRRSGWILSDEPVVGPGVELVETMVFLSGVPQERD